MPNDDQIQDEQVPAPEDEEVSVDVELMATHIQAVASAVFGMDFLFQTGYSKEHGAIILTVVNPRIDDQEKASITAAIPAKSGSVLGARYIACKIAAQLFQVEHDQHKSGLIVPKSGLIIPGH